jgi:glycine reductase
MVKEIERYGLPVVHMATITTISESVGANRIVPTVAIPHPVGNPKLDPENEHKLRKNLVNKALTALTTEITEPTYFD